MTQGRSPEQLEREVTDARRRVGATMDAIEDRLAPQQLVGDALRSVQSYGLDTASNLGASIRQNPAALLLIGTGALLLLRGSGTSGQASQMAPATGSNHGGIGGSVTSAVGEAVRGVRRRMSSAAESMSSAAGSVSSAMSSAAGSVSSAAGSVSSAAGSVHDRYDRMTTETRSLVGRSAASMSRLMDEQPVVLGAVAMAIGAALGGMVPSTRQERVFLDKARDVVETGMDRVRGEDGDGDRGAGADGDDRSRESRGGDGSHRGSSADASRPGSMTDSSRPGSRTDASRPGSATDASQRGSSTDASWQGSSRDAAGAPGRSTTSSDGANPGSSASGLRGADRSPSVPARGEQVPPSAV